MADESDPPRKFYQLKPRPFEQVNAPLSSIAPPSSQGQPHQPMSGEKIDVRDHYEQSRTPGPVLTPPGKPVEQNQVHTILQDNLAHANAAGLNTLTYKRKRRSRRTRDYFLVTISLDAFFVVVAFGPYSNVALMAYGVAGIIITTLGLWWVMFFVMDDY
jgi:hypothetical protein